MWGDFFFITYSFAQLEILGKWIIVSALKIGIV